VPTEIDLEQLRGLLDRGDVQLVEVLPPREFEEEHVPGAVNIPLKSLTPAGVAGLDRDRPVVVYCWDDD
jgi:rhodanese-related sulfurtransferase